MLLWYIQQCYIALKAVPMVSHLLQEANKCFQETATVALYCKSAANVIGG